ncbi:hypothetical protein T492DRAFT_1031262 [Pavlovales sp. CCMP2436]|nr:hypothetical protein T492DRAFT_1031262 [Pavlovales sp. CCMP2436]
MDGEARELTREPTRDIPGLRMVAEALAISRRLLDRQPKEGPDFSQEARHLYICTLLQFTKLGRKFGGSSYSPDKVAAAKLERAAAIAEFERSSMQHSDWVLLVSDYAKIAFIGSFFNPARVQQNRRDAVAAAPHLDDAGKGTYMCWDATASQRARARSAHTISRARRSARSSAAVALMADDTRIRSLAFHAAPLQRALLSPDASTSAAALTLAPLATGTSAQFTSALLSPSKRALALAPIAARLSTELQRALLSSDASTSVAALTLAPLATGTSAQFTSALLSPNASTNKRALALAPIAARLSTELQRALLSPDASTSAAALTLAPLATGTSAQFTSALLSSNASTSKRAREVVHHAALLPKALQLQMLSPDPAAQLDAEVARKTHFKERNKSTNVLTAKVCSCPYLHLVSASA